MLFDRWGKLTDFELEDWEDLGPDRETKCPQVQTAERLEDYEALNFRQPRYVPLRHRRRREFTDLSKQPGGYCIDNYFTGDSHRLDVGRHVALRTFEIFSPGFTWTEVPRFRWEELNWVGLRNDLIRIGTLDLSTHWHTVNIMDHPESWKLSLLVWQNFDDAYESCTVGFLDGENFALRCPLGQYPTLPRESNEASVAQRYFSHLVDDLEAWRDL